MNPSPDFHLRWLARYFGRPDYLPLTREDVEALVRAGRAVEFESGSYLYREGDDAEAAFLLQSGRVELRRNGHLVGRLGPGATAGDIELFLEGPYMSSALVTERATAFHLRREAVVGEMAENPRIALRWLVAALRQLEVCQRRVVLLLRRPLRAQVADVLLDEADESGRVTTSHEELAHLLGVSRPAVSRAIAELRRAGLLASTRGAITIVDREGMEQITTDEWADREQSASAR